PRASWDRAASKTSQFAAILFGMTAAARQTRYRERHREEIREREKALYREDPRGVLLKAARHRAKRAGVPFDMSIDDVVIPETCPLLGIPIFIGDGRATQSSPPIAR